MKIRNCRVCDSQFRPKDYPKGGGVYCSWECKKESRKLRTHKPRYRAIIYIIQAENGGPFKLGYTNSLNKRLGGLQTASPYKLKVIASIPGTKDLEKALHKKYSLWRLEGEWFDEVILEKVLREFDFRENISYTADTGRTYRRGLVLDDR